MTEYSPPTNYARKFSFSQLRPELFYQESEFVCLQCGKKYWVSTNKGNDNIVRALPAWCPYHESYAKCLDNVLGAIKEIEVNE